MKTKLLKKISVWVLILCMLFADILPVSADELLHDTDNIFCVDMVSTTSGNALGYFFKKDQTLYVDYTTLLSCGPVSRTIGKDGKISKFTRDDNGAEYVVGETVSFNGETYYPFIEAATKLCINFEYMYEYDVLVAVPTKNVWEILDYTTKLEKNKIYQMYDWRTSKYMDPDMTKLATQVCSIGRNLFEMPENLYGYVTGNTDYKHYCKALWQIMLPEIGQDMYSLGQIDDVLDYFGVLGTLGDLTEEAFQAKDFSSLSKKDLKLYTKAVGQVTDIVEMFQFGDVYEELRFSYGFSRINSNTLNGVKLIRRKGLSDDSIFKNAVDDTLYVYGDDLNIVEVLIRNLGEGTVEAFLGKYSKDLNAYTAVGSLFVDLIDYFAGWFTKNGYSKDQMDAELMAIANLKIQDAARKSYKTIRKQYNSAEHLKEKINLLGDMRDTMLVYMLAGHNAWMEVSNTEGDNEYTTALVMEEDIAKLLNYTELDFNVFQSSYDAAHAVLNEYQAREQTIYEFEWDEEAAEKVGGVDVTLDGQDENEEEFIYKFSFSHLYYQQNGLFVGRIRTNKNTDKYYRNVETRAIKGTCEIILKAQNVGESLEDIGLEMVIDKKKWDGNLDEYLEKAEDGSTYYCIPIPIGSTGVAKPPAPSTTPSPAPSQEEPVSGLFKIETEYAEYAITYDPSEFVLSKGSYGTTFTTAFAEEIAKSLSGYTKQTVYISDTYYDFDFYLNQILAGYVASNNGGEISGELKGEVQEVAIGDLKAQYFDVEYVSMKMASDQKFVNRHFFIDLENGEQIYGQDSIILEHEEQTNISFEEYLQKAFTNIEIEAKADAPKVPVDGIHEMSTDIADYKITYDPEVVRMTKDAYSSYVSYKNGVPGVLYGNLADQIFISSKYSVASEYFIYRSEFYEKSDYYTNVVNHGSGEVVIGDYTVKYMMVSYDRPALGLELHNVWNFYIDLGNGEALYGANEMIPRYGDQIGLTTEEFLQKALIDIEINMK